MKKEILVAISVAGVLFGLSVSLAAQEKLSLAQCREMALKYNKDMAAANKQTEAARLMSLSYKANFFPNFTANGTGRKSRSSGWKPSGFPAQSCYRRTGVEWFCLFSRIESGL